MNLFTKQSGFGLIEIVIGSAIITIIFLAVPFFFQESLKLAQRTSSLVKAGYVMEGGMEAVRFLRDESWSNISGLASGTDYYLTFTGSGWATSTTPSMIDGFTRTFTVEPVFRDANDQIVTSGGSNDPNTKEVTVTVEWTHDGTTLQESMSAYFTNWFN